MMLDQKPLYNPLLKSYYSRGVIIFLLWQKINIIKKYVGNLVGNLVGKENIGENRWFEKTVTNFLSQILLYMGDTFSEDEEIKKILSSNKNIGKIRRGLKVVIKSPSHILLYIEGAIIQKINDPLRAILSNSRYNCQWRKINCLELILWDCHL